MPQPGGWKFPWLIVLFSVLLFFVFSIVIAYRSIVVMATNNQNVTSTLHVISLIDALKAELYAAESGQRGYLVTADAQYLQPYEEALVSICWRLCATPPQRCPSRICATSNCQKLPSKNWPRCRKRLAWCRWGSGRRPTRS